MVRPLQVGGALPDAAFQLGVERLDLRFGLELRGEVADGADQPPRLPVRAPDHGAADFRPDHASVFTDVPFAHREAVAAPERSRSVLARSALTSSG